MTPRSVFFRGFSGNGMDFLSFLMAFLRIFFFVALQESILSMERDAFFCYTGTSLFGGDTEEHAVSDLSE
jgi:hypothetical protein